MPGGPYALKPDGPGAVPSAARRSAKSAVVTVPLMFSSAAAAAWLFGSALGLMGLACRRLAALAYPK